MEKSKTITKRQGSKRFNKYQLTLVEMVAISVLQLCLQLIAILSTV